MCLSLALQRKVAVGLALRVHHNPSRSVTSEAWVLSATHNVLLDFLKNNVDPWQLPFCPNFQLTGFRTLEYILFQDGLLLNLGVLSIPMWLLRIHSNFCAVQ